MWASELKFSLGVIAQQLNISDNLSGWCFWQGVGRWIAPRKLWRQMSRPRGLLSHFPYFVLWHSRDGLLSTSVKILEDCYLEALK